MAKHFLGGYDGAANAGSKSESVWSPKVRGSPRAETLPPASPQSAALVSPQAGAAIATALSQEKVAEAVGVEEKARVLEQVQSSTEATEGIANGTFVQSDMDVLAEPKQTITPQSSAQAAEGPAAEMASNKKEEGVVNE